MSKRILLFIVGLSYLFSYLPERVLAVSNPDQGCADVINTNFFTYVGRWPTMIFKPRFNILDGVSVRIKQVFNEDRGADVTVEIFDYNSSNQSSLGKVTKHITREEEYWELYEFDDISVTPEGLYAIRVSTPELEHAQWQAVSDLECYSRGYAADRYSDRLNDRIFGFATYGRNAPVVQSTSTPSSQPPENAVDESPEPDNFLTPQPVETSRSDAAEVSSTITTKPKVTRSASIATTSVTQEKLIDKVSSRVSKDGRLPIWPIIVGGLILLALLSAIAVAIIVLVIMFVKRRRRD